MNTTEDHITNSSDNNIGDRNLFSHDVLETDDLGRSSLHRTITSKSTGEPRKDSITRGTLNPMSRTSSSNNNHHNSNYIDTSMNSFSFIHLHIDDMPIRDTSDWTDHVSPEIVASLPDMEQKRQHSIFELVKNQTSYTNDLISMQMLYFEPLMNEDIIEETRRFEFRWSIFGPFEDLLQINTRLQFFLTDRQINSNYVFYQVGDIFLEAVQEFTLYEYYGENNEISMANLKAESKKNPKLAAYIKHISSTYRVPDLQSYMTSIIKRLSDYKLVLNDVLKRTPYEHPDQHFIPEVLEELGAVGIKMNSAAKRTQIKRKLHYLQSRLHPDPRVEILHLSHPDREIFYEGRVTLKYFGLEHSITLLLFDHYIVMAKTNDDIAIDDDSIYFEKDMKKTDYPYQIYQNPLHLDLLTPSKSPSFHSFNDLARKQTVKSFLNGPARSKSISVAAGGLVGVGVGFGHGSISSGGTSENPRNAVLFDIKTVEPRSGSIITYEFEASTEAARDQWVKKITEQKNKRQIAWPIIFEDLAVRPFSGHDGRIIGGSVTGERLVVAHENAVVIGSSKMARNKNMYFSQVIAAPNIRQIDVMEELDLFFVLIDRVLYSYSLQSVLMGPIQLIPQRRKIADNVAFFKIGVCDGRKLLCIVGPMYFRWHIKLIDPAKERKKNLFTKGKDFEIFKELVIPTRVTSINFLKSRVVLGCTKGFEMVHLQLVGAAANAPLLDQTDANLKLALGREDLKPISLFRMPDSNFLLCFQDMGFFVTQQRRRVRKDLVMHWRGQPTAFAYISPYIVAIGSHLVEVYHTHTGEMVQCVVSSGLKCIYETSDSLYITRDADDKTHQTVSRLYLAPVSGLGGGGKNSSVMAIAPPPLREHSTLQRRLSLLLSVPEPKQ